MEPDGTAAPQACRIVWCRTPAEHDGDYCLVHLARADKSAYTSAGPVNTSVRPPDHPTMVFRQPCLERGCDGIAVGLTQQASNEALSEHVKEAHRGT